MLIIPSLSTVAAARQLQEDGVSLLLLKKAFLGQDFAKSSAHVFSYILLFKLRSSSVWKCCSAGCRKVSRDGWRELKPTPLPIHALPTAHTGCCDWPCQPHPAWISLSCAFLGWGRGGGDEEEGSTPREKGLEGVRWSSNPGRLLRGELSILPSQIWGFFCLCILI